jgi:twitching motility protein PilT
MIQTIIQGGRSIGMQMMDDALMALVDQKRITPREAYMKAGNKQRFEGLVEGD